jgi:hypothetical protein
MQQQQVDMPIVKKKAVLKTERVGSAENLDLGTALCYAAR